MELPQTITKVFTKYDTIITRMHFPALKPSEASPLTDDTELCFDDILTIDIPYDIVGIEQGLENVVFVHYEQEEQGNLATS